MSRSPVATIRRLRLTALVVAAVCGLIHPGPDGGEARAAVGGAPPGAAPDLAAALHARAPDRLLEFTFASGGFVRGFAVFVQADSVYLRRDRDGDLVSAYALDAVAVAREWRSNAVRGLGWGATSGAVLVGGFGALLGAYVTSINGSDDSDIAPLFVFTLSGVALGAVAGGAIGGGLGALTASWQEFWPEREEPPAPGQPRYSEDTRLGLFGGVARSLLDGYEVSRFAAQVSLCKNVGPVFDLGPEIGYFAFNGSNWDSGENGRFVRGRDNVLKVGLTVNYRPRRAGLGPFATTGLGWFLSDDAYLGAHLGGGLRWQTIGGHDLELDIRHHLSLTGVSASQVDRFWTLGLGLGFSL